MRTTWRFALSAALAAGIGCAGGAQAGEPEAAPNTLTEKEKADGWKLIFDGKSTAGWRGFHRPAFPDKGWVVEDGALVHQPKGGGGDLVTADMYESFELSFEWKVSEGANSGVFYHVTEDQGAVYQTGPEYQVLHNQKHPDGRNPATSAASCYAVYPPSKDMTKPQGEWNQGRIVVDGKHVEHWLNGKKVLEFELDSDAVKEGIAKSKFKNDAGFGEHIEGHIMLTYHQDDCWSKNIKIRELK